MERVEVACMKYLPNRFTEDQHVVFNHDDRLSDRMAIRIMDVFQSVLANFARVNNKISYHTAFRVCGIRRDPSIV